VAALARPGKRRLGERQTGAGAANVRICGRPTEQYSSPISSFARSSRISARNSSRLSFGKPRANTGDYA